MRRDELVNYLDDYLKIHEIKDSSKNGLQVEGREEVRRVAVAVDACLDAFEKADQWGADMVIVHHGLFWDEVQMIRGISRNRIKHLLDFDLSLYAVHLPLDLHEEIGHNVELARLLELPMVGTFGEYHGTSIGIKAELSTGVDLDDFLRRIEAQLTADLHVLRFGPRQIKRVGIVSGGGSFAISEAGAEHLDMFLTGETSHGAFHVARENAINVVYAGHYVTETPGLKALARHLTRKFHLETKFLHIPTGF